MPLIRAFSSPRENSLIRDFPIFVSELVNWHRILHLLLQTRYLLTGTSCSHNFFTERLQVPRRCAWPSSDRFFIVSSPS